jgi:hypothetical protein
MFRNHNFSSSTPHFNKITSMPQIKIILLSRVDRTILLVTQIHGKQFLLNKIDPLIEGIIHIRFISKPIITIWETYLHKFCFFLKVLVYENSQRDLIKLSTTLMSLLSISLVTNNHHMRLKRI